MNMLEADLVVKAIVDGEDELEKVAERSGVTVETLQEYSDVLDRAIQLMSGFYKYGHENMKPAGLPPPPNPYLNKNVSVEDQSAEYFAFEALQRRGPNRERALLTCTQLGLDEATAELAIDNVSMPWREVNGWRSYVQLEADGRHVLQDKPPVKLKRHLDRILGQLTQ